MPSYLDNLPYSDAKRLIDQTEDARVLPLLIDIAPFMDEDEWLSLLDLSWARIPNKDEYGEQLLQTPYGKQADDKSRHK